MKYTKPEINVVNIEMEDICSVSLGTDGGNTDKGIWSEIFG